jgi:hypothetical protein
MSKVDDTTRAELRALAGPIPPSAVDASGRLLPQTDEERRARTEGLRNALDQMERITDETDDDATWAEVYRGIDAGRPHRPLFKGLY